VPLRRVPWAKYFVGSEYVKGLFSNYTKFIDHGVWGFLTAPIHPYAGGMTQISDLMLDGIGIAVERLRLEPTYEDKWEHRFEGE